jgi:hypothetical protein
LKIPCLYFSFPFWMVITKYKAVRSHTTVIGRRLKSLNNRIDPKLD